MQIKIVSVGSPEMKQGPKAKYSVFKLEYSSDGQLRNRNIMSFAKEVYGVLKSAEPGSVWDIVTKKNGEFWDWVSATPVGAGSGTQLGAGGVQTTAPTGSGGYSRESAEERAQRQVLIVRQSCLSSAVNALGNQIADPQRYIDFAKEFEKYVFDFSVPTEEIE